MSTGRQFLPGFLTATLSFLAVVTLTADEPAKDAEALKLTLRSRVQPFKSGGDWAEVTLNKDLPAKETAILICDMWDKHWCQNATTRCGELAKKMVPVLAAARARGVLIIHAPSECMDFYKDTPQRKRAQEAPKVDPPKSLDLNDPPLPVDSSDGGCDDEPPSKFSKAWSRQTELIPIEEADVISDNGQELYNVLRQRGIKNIIYMGVHTNMCVLGRTFAIRQMSRWGVHCLLVRDLTDSMYNPKMPPKVAHEEGTELIIQHIEKYWGPTLLAADLEKAAKGEK
jgi:nicotinamidase-related amidase